MSEADRTILNYGELLSRTQGRQYAARLNTRLGWYDIESLDTQIEKGAHREYLFEVDLPENAKEEASDVLNLQYFFVRTERALRVKREEGEDAVFILLVNVHNKSDIYRVSAYLYIQSVFRTDMLFYIKYRNNLYVPKEEQRGVGRLPPLICVARKDEGHSISCDQLAGKQKLNSEQIQECIDEVKEQLMKSGKRSKDEAEESGEGENQSAPEEKKEEPTRFQRLFQSGRFTLIQAICANYLIEALCKIKGVAWARLQPEEKCKQIDILHHYILDRQDSITFLGQLIWFIYLYYLQDSKEVVEWDRTDNTGKTFVTRYDRLDKCFMDSIEYADGLLQLLENSCQHTQSGVGYLSIRVHYVDKNCPESELENVAFRRSHLINRYSRNLGSKKNAYFYFPQRLTLDEEIPYYFEIRVIDDATYFNENSVRARGIPEMHARNRGLEVEDSIQLYIIFGRLLNKNGNKNKPTEKTLENITYHYGVRLLQKIVLRNCGCFMVSTPSIKTGYTEIYSTYFEKELPKKYASQKGESIEVSDSVSVRRGLGWQQIRSREACRSTEYQILLPVGYRWQDTTWRQTHSIRPTKLPLDLSVLREGVTYRPTREYRLADEFAGHFKDNLYGSMDSKNNFDPSGKKKKTEELFEILKTALAADGKKYGNKIYVLSFSGLGGMQLELASKALFRYIGMEAIAGRGNPEGRMLIAAYFDSTFHAREFILNYSVFYDERGDNPFMEGVQIAICSLNSKTKLPEVNFLLAGTSLASAWETAETFAYYNSDSTLSLLPQIRYLSDDSFWVRNEEEPIEAVAPFPFDIFLRDIPKLAENMNKKEDRKENGGSEGGKDKRPTENMSVFAAPASECWFLRRMASMINSDLRDPELGCKINNVHVRLGSKMHIEDFYEAELLFQNISVVSRFAFLIVQSIVCGSPKISGPLLIVGYENYSTILLEYVVRFLEACGLEAVYGLFGYDSSGKGQFFKSAALLRKPESFLDTAQVITIYPIGTTLSTIYQMIDSIHEGYSVNPYMNFCVLVVDGKKEDRLLRERYWIREEAREGLLAPTDEQLSTLTIQQDKAERSPTKVRYFLEARTHWHDSRQCIDSPPEKEDVLTYVDSTSTVPNMIFPLRSRKNDGPGSFLKEGSRDEEKLVYANNRRIEQLKGCISYGHILSGNNHFLYDLNLPLYFENVKANLGDDLDSWLNNLSLTVDSEAFNVIVAPLERDNAAFLHAVVEKVFAHSIRVLRIPFLESRKEDVRAKFSFITEEYASIKAANPNIRINIYYVSTSIVTGETFYRASKLIGMLLNESGCYQKSAFLFKGMFLLVNRSSRSTIQTMVEDPNRDFHAYLQLLVPHYNTYKGICPACIRHQLGQRIIRNCSTNACLDIFLHKEEKLSLRTREEYHEGLLWELWESTRGFSMLCRWLYRFRNVYPDGLDRNKLSKFYELCLETQKCKYDCATAGICLNDLWKKATFPEREYVEQLWFHYVLQDKAYLRLSSTHKAYFDLEDKDLLECTSEKMAEKARACILNLFCKENEAEDLPPEEFIERIISYVKVLSREYLSKHHYIRQAIFRVLADMLQFLLGKPPKTPEQEELSSILSTCRRALPLQQYQLLITVLRQLSSMQANMVIRDDLLIDLNQKIERLREEQENRCVVDEAAGLCPLPPEQAVEQDYESCIKWGMLSGDEENKCILLQREQLIWKETSGGWI